MAAGIVAQGDLARQAIRNHDQSAALDAVRQAQSWAAQIQSQTAGRPQPVLIPVTQEKETTTTYTDVKHGKGGEMTASRLKKHTHVSGVEEQTTADALNVTTAAEYLATAKADLERSDWTAADADLTKATALVRTSSLDSDVPLMRAQENLRLARTRLAEGKSSAAVAPLRQAAQALSDFAKEGGSSFSEQAENMRRNIDAMAGDLHDAGSIGRIDEWLGLLGQWQKQ
jgi:hypothetical protein